MLALQSIHHVAIICSDYDASKKFYTDVLGFEIIAEHFRSERKSWKLDLSLKNHYIIELFSFPDPPPRVSKPEARGLRHIAFAVNNVNDATSVLRGKGVVTEAVRIDEFTGKRYTFFADPDGLPIELYEA
jgi:glyoxylase I family protein